MPIAATNAYSTGTGNGAATVFPYTFTARSTAEVQVLLNGVVQTSGFSIALNPQYNGGNVTFTTAPASGATVIIASNPAFTQTVSFGKAGPYSPDQVDGALDELAIHDIFLLGLLKRSLLAPIGETPSSLPSATARANMLLGFDAFGNPTASNPASITGAKGDPGGNVAAIGLFTQASTLTIPSGTNAVRTSGYSANGVGIADYLYDPSVNSSYVASNPKTSFLSANNLGFRLAEQTYRPEMFGAKGDGTTDDSGAIEAAIAFLVAKGGGGLYFGPKTYLCNSSLTWSGAPITLEGAGQTIQPGNVGTILKFPTGLSGAVNPQTGSAGLGAGSIIRNLRIMGSGTAKVSDANALLGVGAGILLQANGARIENVTVQGFEGNGVYLLSSIGAPNIAINTNTCSITGLTVYSNLCNGFATYGTDSNACTITDLSAINNGEFGVYENSYVGNNVYIRPHFSGNTNGPLRFGNSTINNRVVAAYKEVGAALLVQFDAGGGGKNVVEFATATGTAGTPNVWTITDNTASQDNDVIVPGFRYRAGFGTTAPVYIQNGLVELTAGGQIQWQDSPLTANWFGSCIAGNWLLQNGGIPYFKVTTAGFGYGGGTGGAVTQATSKSTGVTLNKLCGQITMNNAALASGAKVSFVVTNSALAATDTIIANVASGGTANAYRVAVTAIAAGSFTLTVENITAGSLSESPVINFALLKASAS